MYLTSVPTAVQLSYMKQDKELRSAQIKRALPERVSQNITVVTETALGGEQKTVFCQTWFIFNTSNVHIKTISFSVQYKSINSPDGL